MIPLGHWLQPFDDGLAVGVAVVGAAGAGAIDDEDGSSDEAEGACGS